MSAAHPRRGGPSERGAVIVMVAIWLPVLALFVSFAVDFAHFFDYSRNLQNRADAAALAAGNAYGGACFGTYDTTQTDAIGQAAQQYAGPPVQDPANPYTVPINLPYAYNSADPDSDGDLNGDTDNDGDGYQNVPNLTQGTPPNYHLLLNSTQYFDAGGTDWNMGSDTAKGSSLALCKSTDEDGKTGAMADVRITQSNLGLFFPLLGFTPTISAHARVALFESAGSNSVIPIAVRDPAATQCVDANFFDVNAPKTPLPGSPVHMTSEGTDATTGNAIWDIPAGTSVPMPANGDNVFVQIVTGPCGDSPSTYDDQSGLLYLNAWSTGSVGSGQPPKITAGGVTLTGICPNDGLSNQYFTDAPCAVGVTAHVTFAPGTPYSPGAVTATDTSGKGGPALPLSKLSTQVNKNQTVAAGGQLAVNSTLGFTPTGSIDDNGVSFAYSAIVDGTHFRLTNGGTFKNNDYITQTGDTTWTSSGTFDIEPGSGRHPISISAGGTNFGVQQQAFGACDNDVLGTCNNPPDDSGPIVLAQLRLKTDADGVYGQNAFAGGSPTPSLNLKIELAGLNNTPPAGPPTILRFSEPGSPNQSHATGLINCGQTSQGTSQAITAIIGGCPVAGSTGTNGCPVGSNNWYFCSPLAINRRSDACPTDGNSGQAGSIIPPATSPSYRTPATPTVPTDCIGLVGGNKTPIAQAIACRIFTNTTPGTCANGNIKNAICSADNWSPSKGASSVPGSDPRAITMVITAPEDLSGNSGPPVPIRNFATFYVTGWNTQGSASGCAGYTGVVRPPAASDALAVNQCTDGTKEPAGGCKTTGPPKNRNGGDPGEVWGYWMTYIDPNGIPTQTLCDPKKFGTCVPALTR